MLPQFATVILPLAVEGSFTYVLPPEFAEQVHVGSRVVVQFGSRRYYTGIVVQLFDHNPQPQLKLKPITDVADAHPVVLPAQLHLWQWLSSYYMCTVGEVMCAALPTGLKLESQTQLVRNADCATDQLTLTPQQEALLAVLDDAKGCTLMQLSQLTGQKNVMLPARQLIEMGAVSVREAFTRGFKPRTEMHVRLSDEYFDEETINHLFDTLKRASAQEALLLRYLDMAAAPTALKLRNAHLLAEVSRAALCEERGADAALRALVKRGVLETYAYTVSRLRTDGAGQLAEAHKLIGRQPLSVAQQQAFDHIVASWREKPVCLLHGVTSSGKTEVYVRLIEQALARGEQVLYLLPEIALTTQITSRLSKVFGAKMGVYHSKFPDAERVELWQRQLTADAYPLILGVRSALFLPFQHLGLVIVDEEHEPSYKQTDPAPRYHARDAAIVLAHQVGAKVLLGTATPALETYHNALTGKYGLVEMKERYGGVQLPEIVVEDVKELRRKRLMNSPFSPRLVEAVRGALADGRQAIFFQNRRGWSPVLECRTCGWTPRCTRCDVSLTYHQAQHKLVCHYCGASYDVPQQCPACGDTELRDRGFGTERIEQEAARIFPEARTARLDLDTTRSRTAYEKIIADFASGRTNLLIGTQMVSKGLDFGGVAVVGILSADQMLNQPDFRATERAYQMMQQVAGRAGRRQGRGLVVLQTSQAELPVIGQTVRGDYASLYDSLMQERTEFGYPPACRLISICLKHRTEAVVNHAALALADMLRPHFGAGLLGPDRPVVSRVQMLYLRKLLLKVPHSLPPAGVRRTLLSARSLLLAQAAYKSVSVVFDVDP